MLTANFYATIYVCKLRINNFKMNENNKIITESFPYSGGYYKFKIKYLNLRF